MGYAVLWLLLMMTLKFGQLIIVDILREMCGVFRDDATVWFLRVPVSHFPRHAIRSCAQCNSSSDLHSPERLNTTTNNRLGSLIGISTRAITFWFFACGYLFSYCNARVRFSFGWPWNKTTFVSLREYSLTAVLWSMCSVSAKAECSERMQNVWVHCRINR